MFPSGQERAVWIAGRPELAGAGSVWGTLGKNEGRGYGGGWEGF